jgi:hypothetical protein
MESARAPRASTGPAEVRGARPPAFLGIGAQKAATTWLDRCLRSHPSLWLPPLKELHYFDDVPGRRTFLAPDWAGRRLRRQVGARLRSDARHADLSGLAWDLRYFAGRRSDRWYLSLFPRDPRRMSGEITPDYSILGEKGVARAHRLLPDVRLIFLMRDPIDRSWSQIRMDVRRTGRRAGDLPLEELIALARSDRVARRSDYERTLRHWGRHYGTDRFFIGFLEDVRERPERLLEELFVFLGVDPAAARLGDLLRRRVHSRVSEDWIPAPLERELARIHLPGLVALGDRFGEPVAGWRARAERVSA